MREIEKVKTLYRNVDIADENVSQSGDTNNDLSKVVTIEERLTNAMAKVTLRDYNNWIEHSITYFPRCLAQEENL